MPSIIASNLQVLGQLNSARSFFNGAKSLRLFTNDFTPTCASLETDFSEANFVGYTRLSTAGSFPTPIKLVDGIYQTTSAAFTWTAAFAASQRIYGWYLLDAGQLRLSSRFAQSIVITFSLPLTVRIGLQEASLSLFGV